MNKRLVFVIGVLLTGAMTWAAFGQAQGGGRGGFGRNREAQQKAIAALQEEIGKLKAMMEQQGQGMRGRSFQDMSDDERAKMREEMNKRMEQRQQIMASIQQQLDTLRGGMEIMREHQQAMEPLKDLLASAQSEKATATAAKIQKVMDEKQKQFEAKMAAMGYDPERLQGMMERMSQRRGQ